MNDNQLIISGVVCKAVKHSQNVAGIPYSQFVIEHRSEQVEANLPRSSYVRLAVVASAELAVLTQDLDVGHAVRLSGFLHRHQQQNGVATLVLHANTLTRIS